jgi:hypothetical protein
MNSLVIKARLNAILGLNTQFLILVLKTRYLNTYKY